LEVGIGSLEVDWMKLMGKVNGKDQAEEDHRANTRRMLAAEE
jgi:hypothetical protein